jgi:8-oxo-dGTP pyrophosphatase MutT (NUDIX family)
MGGSATGLMRHILACANVTLPGGRLPFRLEGTGVGWVRPDFARLLLRHGCREAEGGMELRPASALPALARALAEAGCYRWRGEAFDVRAAPGGPVLATIDRGALPSFGILAEGVHMNGLVRRPDGLHLWVARRAADRQLDPGKLDHLVAGGVPAGMDPMAALIKEAAEEAGLDPALAARARKVAGIGYAMKRPEGLRRDFLHCYALSLPDSSRPRPVDGEAAGFELWPLPRVLETVRTSDAFKFNVNLVLIDLFLRTGLVDPGSAEGRALRRALDACCRPEV